MKKPLLLGIGVYILGFIIVTISVFIFGRNKVEYSYYYAIIYSILYLSSIVTISTYNIINEIRRK